MARKQAARQVWYFGPSGVEAGREMREVVGGKGANLAEMARLGLNIPPGFSISTDACLTYLANGNRMPAKLPAQIARAMRRLERDTGRQFGAGEQPLLLSVRSGAAISMPGMMDTVLNLGLNAEMVETLARYAGNRRMALDAWRRLIGMFGDVVMQVPYAPFEQVLTRARRRAGVELDHDLPEKVLEQIVRRYLAIYRDHTGENFPEDPQVQLERAVEAVFRSWNTPRAVAYRRLRGIADDLGTAVNVQMMVFGNLGPDSATGVAFTRDPATGDSDLYGEFLIDPQGEDVVAGIRTPEPVKGLRDWNPRVWRELQAIKKKLERHFRDMQDIEFTVERGRLWMLQTRTGQRTAAAALAIATSMVRERLTTRREALLRVAPGDLEQLLHPSFDPHAPRDLLTRGLPASPGAAVGQLAFSAEETVARQAAGEQVILVRAETNAEDVRGMHAATGILTSTGGTTSHAAVVARGWGKCCVSGAGELAIDEARRRVLIAGRSFGADDTLSIDGSSGEVMAGAVATREAQVSGDFAEFMAWADAARRLGVRANADKPADAARARSFGAEGIGLCRTEHMFFEGERIGLMRAMILADTEAARRDALAALLPFQRADFEGLLAAMHGLPVTIRLLDPPLHEFLPQDAAAQAALATQLGVEPERVRELAEKLAERNPMLGNRGCRLAICYPEILEMQVQAITEAAVACRRKRIDVRPEIMIPLVGFRAELAMLRQRTEAVIARTRKALRFRGQVRIPIGTMIELPRAALVADRIAEEAEFFSFGTNDLTQMTLGFSRDDAGTFLPRYLDEGVFAVSPFQTLDRNGVGQLVELGVQRGRATRPSLTCGLCGEHGGDPESIDFCHEAGLDYVSCSPFRVPVARLAAAQAALRAGSVTRR